MNYTLQHTQYVGQMQVDGEPRFVHRHFFFFGTKSRVSCKQLQCRSCHETTDVSRVTCSE